MTTKEKVIRQSQKILTRKIDKIRNIVFGNHVSKMFEVEKDAIETAKKMLKEGKDVTKYLEKKCKERDRLYRLAKQSCNSIKLTNQLVESERELHDLDNELYYIERTKKTHNQSLKMTS